MTSKDSTFSAFTPEQAAAYATNRGHAYPRPLYDKILQYHEGARNIALDVGTGPGKVAFDFLDYFDKAYGCDVGESMIEQAKKDAARLGVQDRTRFAVAGGETCAEGFPGEKVDLITVAMAAHWFDLPKFYASAAKILKPGGTLAIFTCSSTYVHPSTPNHEEIQKILFELEDGMLAPYRTPGNALTRAAYETLDLPWSVEDTQGLFDKESFHRKDWDRHGVPSAPPLPDGTPGPFLFLDVEGSIEVFAQVLASASMVIRWRAANPDKANTEEDPVRITARKLKEANGGSDKLRMSPSLSLLLMRRV